MYRTGQHVRGRLPLDVSSDFYDDYLANSLLFTDPEAHLFDAEDVSMLLEQSMGRSLLSVKTYELESDDDFDGKYEVVVKTRAGEVTGEGSYWAEAAARALGAWVEIRRRAALDIFPIPQKDAFDFVETYHRHHVKPVGSKFQLGAFATVNDETTWVGVVVVGLPVSKWLAAQGCWEVTRMAVLEHGQSYLSQLYAAAWKNASKRGCKRLVTYIRADEPGSSLKAVGWRQVATTSGRSWSSAARLRVDKTEIVDRTRWEIQSPDYVLPSNEETHRILATRSKLK